MSQWSDRWDASGVIANVAELEKLRVKKLRVTKS
jgi:hypothetical protein